MTRFTCAWTPRCAPRFAVLLALLAGAPAQAHTIVGDRVFPATLTIDDPGVNDELALPAFSYMTGSNFDGSPGPISYSLGWEYSKTITAALAFSLGSAGYNWQRRPNRRRAGPTSKPSSNMCSGRTPSREHHRRRVQRRLGQHRQPANRVASVGPLHHRDAKAYTGKGFGDASLDWARPFAVTGEVDYTVADARHERRRQPNPSTLTYGATLQYSLLYRNSHVEEVPEAFRKLIPAFEAMFTTPIANIAPRPPAIFRAQRPPASSARRSITSAQYFEVGVMAQIPVNRASGSACRRARRP